LLLLTVIKHLFWRFSPSLLKLILDTLFRLGCTENTTTEPRINAAIARQIVRVKRGRAANITNASQYVPLLYILNHLHTILREYDGRFDDRAYVFLVVSKTQLIL
jgi:hypothetical protein